MTDNPADKIKEKLKESGIKQAYLARKLGISPQQLTNILNSKGGSRYLPKIHELLEIDGKQDKICTVKVLLDADLLSLVDGSVLFEEITAFSYESYPFAVPANQGCFFAYRLKNLLNSMVINDDLLLFGTFLPIEHELTGKLGIASIKNDHILIGRLKYDENDGSIYLYNDCDLVNLRNGDYIIGIADQLNRKIRGAYGKGNG